MMLGRSPRRGSPGSEKGAEGEKNGAREAPVEKADEIDENPAEKGVERRAEEAEEAKKEEAKADRASLHFMSTHRESYR